MKKMKLLRRFIMAALSAAVACTAFTSCPDKNQTAHERGSSEGTAGISTDGSAAPTETIDSNTAKFTIEIGGKEAGSFVITLRPDVAPITCENFKELVSSGFYDGLTFHRVVDNFMAQGGDPNGDGTGGAAKEIKGEFASNGVENNLSHTRGVVSMARSSDPDSASSQFFICYTDCSPLDGDYAAFGEVTEGMEVVDSFLHVERTLNSNGEMAVPVEPIVIKKAEMIEDK